MATIATIWAELGLSTDKFDKGLDKALGDVGSKTKNLGKNLMGIGAAATAGLTVPIAGAALGMISSASDLEESMNAVNVVFGDSAGVIEDYSKTSAQTVGLAASDFGQLSAVTGAFLKNLGYDTDTAADQTIALTERAADMASIFNTDVSQALGAIQSGLKGEFNPLEQFGVKLNAASIEAYALSSGMAASKDELTDQIKAQAALALVMEQTNQFAGDFKNTSDGLANSTRIVKAQIKDAAASMGQQLLPIALQVVTAIKGLVDRFSALNPAQQKTILIIGGIVAAIGPLITIIGGLISGIGAIIPVIGAVAGALTFPLIAIIAAVIGVIALLVAAWKNNWGGIQEKTQAVIAFLKPLFDQFIQGLVNLWQNVLLPALQAVWSFFKTNILPIFSAVADVIGAVLGVALKVFIGYIQNVTIPALKFLWEIFQSKILPVLKVVWEWLKTKLGPAFEGIGRAISGVVEWLHNLADNISNIQLPAWLTPGSPTPFEMGLRGISDALKEVSSVQMPALQASIATPGGTSGGGGSPVTVGSIIINANVTGEQDWDYVAQKISRKLTQG